MRVKAVRTLNGCGPIFVTYGQPDHIKYTEKWNNAPTSKILNYSQKRGYD